MCRSSIVFWCYVFLLGASSSDSLGYSTNDNERRGNQTTRYDLVNSTKDRDDEMQPILYNLRENSTKNDDDVQHASRVNSDDSARYKYHGHIMTFHKENDQMFMESRANPAGVDDEIYSMLQAFNENVTKTDRENNSMSYELHRNFNTDDYNDTRVNITSYEACDNETCIQLCCPYGDRLTSEKKCIAGRGNYYFPAVYRNDSGSKRLNELFQLTVRDPCVLQGSAHRVLNPKEYLFFVNGSLYQDSDKIVSSTSYCLGVLDRDIYDAVVCLEQIGFPTYISVCLLVSLPFLLLTFVVYSILPEVQNIHSCTLRVHVASLFISNLLIFCIQEVPELSEWKYCIPLAYIFNFSMLSGCFWLNATCFDIWWTFKKLNLHQPNIRKKKRKFLMYSIYAWGVTFGLNVACVIMDYAPGIPKNLIRPEMCEKKFWLGEKALTVYFYGPTGAAFISNVCFFFGTALAILYHNKHTAHQLRDSESRRYDRKKRKFDHLGC
ncbi:PREDICTED: probable G-protein coupled receptor Mth-like 10 isoform X2 [Vollenhovia emeryi]|uniref:probable G-protein coupled receptor Mth-like 10 isoform X2 n=1 Tax=Vollenhovia emeryi TaxID=411798 RepID=UPI0005F4A8AD|nr:PREDICTED: probable G-protein coupled receptor Mth-like 10 isoform X2 [Vollenhovia emeryi]